MKTKHTPGPWKYSGLIGRSPGAIMAGDLQVAHALALPKLYGKGITPEEADANAKLIAAATELLEAAKDCADFMGSVAGTEKVSDSFKASLQAARAAIDKATN